MVTPALAVAVFHFQSKQSQLDVAAEVAGVALGRLAWKKWGRGVEGGMRCLGRHVEGGKR